MITQVYLDKRRERERFVEEAVRAFQTDKTISTYTESDITQGCLFAIRWGLLDDCIVVFNVDANEPVENYVQVIPR